MESSCLLLLQLLWCLQGLFSVHCLRHTDWLGTSGVIQYDSTVVGRGSGNPQYMTRAVWCTGLRDAPLTTCPEGECLPGARPARYF